MSPIFLYGTLRHPPLLEIVAGRADAGTPAELADHAVFHAGEAPFPRLEPAPGQTARGLLVEAGKALERLDFYEGGYGYALEEVEVLSAEGPRKARVYRAGATVPPAGAPWSLEAWAAAWGELTCHVAREAMESFGEISAETLAARMPMMRVRAWARVNAGGGAQTLSLAPVPEAAAEVVAQRRPYTNFFSLLEGELRQPLFAGGHGPVVNRAAFVGVDAAVILPYDPVLDRVLLIEQFRHGPFFRGDPNCFLIEAPAGGMDPGEGPEDAARRELREETGLDARALHLASSHYPSSAAFTEFLHIYVAIADLPDGAAGMGGLETEQEDIRSHLLDYARFEALLDADAFKVGPLVIAGFWLARNRARLRS
ncbi:MAG: NUDIX domain-containing protein [Pseudomonadota bacterium]